MKKVVNFITSLINIVIANLLFRKYLTIIKGNKFAKKNVISNVIKLTTFFITEFRVFL